MNSFALPVFLQSGLTLLAFLVLVICEASTEKNLVKLLMRKRNNASV